MIFRRGQIKQFKAESDENRDENSVRGYVQYEKLR
jgi:hypothetical protein